MHARAHKRLLTYSQTFTQGNLIGRGVIEFCDGGPPVRAYSQKHLYCISFR